MSDASMNEKATEIVDMLKEKFALFDLDGSGPYPVVLLSLIRHNWQPSTAEWHNLARGCSQLKSPSRTDGPRPRLEIVPGHAGMLDTAELVSTFQNIYQQEGIVKADAEVQTVTLFTAQTA